MTETKYIKSTSVAIGIMLACNILSPLISAIIPNAAVAVVLIPLSYILFRYKKNSLSKSTFSILYILSLFFLLFWGYSIIVGSFNNLTIEYCLNFIIFGIPFIIIPNINYSPKVVLITSVYISFISLPYHLSTIDLLFASYSSDSVELMVLSYNIVKIAVPAFLLLLMGNNKATTIIICIAIIIVSTLVLFILGARGAILALIISCLLGAIYRKNKVINFISVKFIFISLIIILTIVFFKDIVVDAYTFLSRHDIHLIALDRIVEQLDSHKDISSGRGALYEMAIEGFIQSPFFGNGIASFQNYSGVYPHNIFLQLLYEGGLIFGLPIIIITALSFVTLNSSTISRDKRFLLIYLIGTYLMQLLFSSYLWYSPGYWFLFGEVITTLKNGQQINKSTYRAIKKTSICPPKFNLRTLNKH